MVKHAMSKRASEGQDIPAVCLGVTFFSTPHHGSSVLSRPEYVQAVQKNLKLKFEMSHKLRHEFRLDNPDLELLNWNFALGVAGVKIYSYIETKDTALEVMSTNELGLEAMTTVKLCIVGSRSGKLGTSAVPIEDEDVRQLGTTHIGGPRFFSEDVLYQYYIDEITAFVMSFSAAERQAYHDLNNDIMTNTQVDVHQFYAVENQKEPRSMKILSASPSLHTFLTYGPAKCMDERIRGSEMSPPIDDELTNGTTQPFIVTRNPRAAAKLPITPKYVPTLRPTLDRTASVGRVPMPDFTLPITRVESKSSHLSEDDASRRPHATPNNIASPGQPQHDEPVVGPDLPKQSQPWPPRESNHVHSRGVKFSDQPRSTLGEKAKDAEIPKPQHTHLFLLPNAASDRFKWIHVPFTHSGWVPHLLATVSHEKDDLNLHSTLLDDKLWFSQHNSARHAAPHAQFVRPSVKCLLPNHIEKSPVERMTTPLSPTKDVQFVVYLPYLHWDSFKNLQRRADIIDRRRKQTHARPVAKDVVGGKSMEHKLIWQHLASDRPIHCRRTLDQYGYPTLRNTAVRDADQILYKRTKPDKDSVPSKDCASGSRGNKRSTTNRSSILPGTDDGAAKVLMVDQLWLWIMDDKHVITFFASKEKEEKDSGLRGEGNLRGEIYRDINGDYANQCADPFDFAALAVFHAVKVMLDRTIDRDLQVFGVFEEYISVLTERQTSSFKAFRNDNSYENAKDANEQSHINNRKDLDSLLELRDIEDELDTIERLIKEQQTCITKMLADYQHLEKHNKKGLNGIGFLMQADQFLAENKEHIERMHKSTLIAQKAFKDLLDMKQKQASIVEAHLARDQLTLAREQTEAAVEQSHVIMIFTIVTIIFLPLSFFASVFGINSAEWASQPNAYPSLRTVFTYMTTISLAVIVVALSWAFYRYIRRLLKHVYKIFAKLIYPGLKWLGVPVKNPFDQTKGIHAMLDLEKAQIEEQKEKRFTNVPRTYSTLKFGDKMFLAQHKLMNGVKAA